MEDKDYLLLDMLSLVYEDMDIDAIEERFADLVAEIFSFDRVGLFFVKHRKGILQGKLCKGTGNHQFNKKIKPMKSPKYLLEKMVP